MNSSARRLIVATVVSFGATATCALVALFVYSGTLNSAAIAVVAAVIYMMPLMLLQATTEKPLRRWADTAQFPVDWTIYGGLKLAIGLLVAAIGTSVMLLLGIAHSWRELYLANRMVVVVSLVVACVARLYSVTKDRLEEKNRQLEERVEAEGRTIELHQQDFERAREIQEALMPKQLPESPRWQLAAGCKPSRIVGGDYYDAIRLANGSLAIVIADVSGKGMAAALLMSNLQAIVRAFASAEISPEELCAKANHLIAANVAPGKYITFFYAVVDAGRMRVDYCCAGHNPPMVLHRDGSIESLSEGGPVLGVFQDAVYLRGTTELQSGDCLLLFTDGVTEAMNGVGEEFGEDRLMDVLRNHTADPNDYCKRIMAAINQFSKGALHDDATLLAVVMK